MLGQVFCDIIGKAAKDGMVLSRVIQEYDSNTNRMGKEQWIPCLKWKDGCRKCQTDSNQMNDDQQPMELHEG